MTVPVLLVSGTVGVGKTAVVEAATELLAERSVPHAAVDLDALIWHWPVTSRWHDDLLFENLAALWTGYARHGATRLALARVLEDRGDLDRYCAAIPGAEITVCRLVAPETTRLGRLHHRMHPGALLDWHLARTVRFLGIFDRPMRRFSFRESPTRSISGNRFARVLGAMSADRCSGSSAPAQHRRIRALVQLGVTIHQDASVSDRDVTADVGSDHDTRKALRLAQLTVVYNVVEGVVALTAGILAGLVSLIGFGADSGIESASAVLVSLRLAARLRDGRADEERERRALRLIALTFFALAAYVTIEGVRALVGDEEPDGSGVGIVLLVASLVVMPALAAAKGRVGRRMNDRLVLADAAETRICVLLSVSTLAGLLLFEITGLSWFDPVTGFVIAGFAIMEGREAWEGELVCDDD